MRSSYAYLLVPVLGAVLILTSLQAPAQQKNLLPPAATPTAPPPSGDSSIPPSSSVQTSAAGNLDPIEAIIAQAEKQYQAGRADYAAGHLEAAKEKFNRAFDLMLSGPVSVKSDDRLQQEFDKIVEGTHQLELEALQAGDGFTEQRAEPAPIDEANEMTFPVDPNIKARAEQEMKNTRSDLPLVLNDAVASYINYFSTKGRGFLERGLVRSGRYRDMILRTLRQEGVPQDLIYLAQAESGFHPLALSRAGARGMWQFMASRGTGYGLQRNWWVDERQDPEKSTRAAAEHLKDLYNQFGDWYLAMAAYNSGPGTVQRAVQRTGYADYWELYRRGVLPQETRNYVPIILAVTIMAKNPAQYGLDHLLLDKPVQADRVTINYPVDLRLAAECVDTSVATLQDLNPSLVRLTTPKDAPFELRLPLGTKDKFEKAIAAIPPAMRVWWRYHKVEPGDTLAGIARKYHATATAIAEANNLDKEELRSETKLIIPVTPGRHGVTEGTRFSRHVTRYKVRKGDTVLSVADDFGVPAERIRKWNHLSGNSLNRHRVILIHRPLAESGAGERSEARPGAKSRSGKRGTITSASVSKSHKTQRVRASTRSAHIVRHRVRKGETLSSIASSYNTSVAELRRENGKVASSLKAGSVLVIKSSSSE